MTVILAVAVLAFAIPASDVLQHAEVTRARIESAGTPAPEFARQSASARDRN